jgi:hypothetical protein
VDLRNVPPELRGTVGVHPVPRPPSEEEIATQREAFEYQKLLNDRQYASARATHAFNLVTSGFNQLCKAEEHADKADLELARETRRAAMNVLKSFLET